MNKFGARKVVADNITFDSMAEERRYQDLKLMQRAGEISDLKVHIPYLLSVNGEHVCDYVADFSYHRKTGPDSTAHVLEDVKGMRKGSAWAVFSLKARLFFAIHGYRIEIYPPAVKKSRRRAKP